MPEDITAAGAAAEHAVAKLTTQAGGVSIGRAVGTLAGLATVMVLSRLLSPADYGSYRQVWLVFFTLAPILELGVPPSVSFFGPQLAREALRGAQNLGRLQAGVYVGQQALGRRPRMGAAGGRGGRRGVGIGRFCGHRRSLALAVPALEAARSDPWRRQRG